MPDFLCLYLGNPEECQCCGGWIHADGCVPKGMPAIDGKFCSVECHDAIADLIERRGRV